MWENGLKPTFADIIRLNAIALRAERGRTGESLSSMPRVAFLGGVMFREPTIGSNMWLSSASRIFDSDDGETYMVLRVFSLSMPQDELPDPYDKDAVQEAIQSFKDKIAFATVPQLLHAVGYVIHGFRQDSYEVPALAKGTEDEQDEDPLDTCYEVGLLRQGIVHRLGTAKEIKNLPPRVVREMILRAQSIDMKADVRKGIADELENDYLRTLDEITERLKKEEGKTNG